MLSSIDSGYYVLRAIQSAYLLGKDDFLDVLSKANPHFGRYDLDEHGIHVPENDAETTMAPLPCSIIEGFDPLTTVSKYAILRKKIMKRLKEYDPSLGPLNVGTKTDRVSMKGTNDVGGSS